MKKFLALTLALLMVLSLAACGDNKRASKKEKSNKATVTETQTEPVQVVTDNAETVPAITPSNGEITFGNLTDTTYENDYFGFGIEVPSSWTTKSDSELATLNSTDVDSMLNDFESVISDSQIAYTFYSVDDVTGNNVNVLIENLAKSGNAGLSTEEYLEKVEESLKSYYESTGATSFETETGTLTIGSGTFDYIEIFSEINGVTLDQLQLVIPSEDYLVAITFTVIDIDAFGYIDDYFYTL